MHIGVLGGGLQGCCIALAAAERGATVTIFDRNDDLMTRTAIANEGKIHLGYMYAADPTLETARTMIRGALSFAPFFQRHLGSVALNLSTSNPAAYAIHRDSQHAPDTVAAYLAATHALIAEAAEGRPDAYFGIDLGKPPRDWRSGEIETQFDPEKVHAVLDTPEVAIDPVELAEAVRACIAAHPRIETRFARTVTGAEIDGDSVRVLTEGADGAAGDRFDHAVNALWEGRIALNDAVGLPTNRPWLHRLKYGVSFRLPETAEAPPSTTFVTGPFGEVVSYGDGLTYLTWYPECVHGLSSAATPPDWATYPAEPLRSRIIAGTLGALSDIVPALRGLDQQALPEAVVKGGVIVAWGDTDIYDPGSELHRRYEIGVTSTGRFHSVDPGKLTMAPWFADLCAERICGPA